MGLALWRSDREHHLKRALSILLLAPLLVVVLGVVNNGVYGINWLREAVGAVQMFVPLWAVALVQWLILHSYLSRQTAPLRKLPPQTIETSRTRHYHCFALTGASAWPNHPSTSSSSAAVPAATFPRSAPRNSALKDRHYEKAYLGGICLNWGCIPTKALLSSAETFMRCGTQNITGLGGKRHVRSESRGAALAGVSNRLNDGIGF